MKLLAASRHALTSSLHWRSASRSFGAGLVNVLCAASLAGALLAANAPRLAFSLDTPTKGCAS